MEHQNLYQHFRKEERLFIDRVYEWKMRVEDTYIPFVTPFLNPREQFIISTLFSEKDCVQLYFNGIFEQGERKRALMTFADEAHQDDFGQVLFSIRYPQKFAQLKHNRILGTLLGQGIKREHIGDIVTNGEEWQIVVTKQVAPYIKENCKKVGSISVGFDEIDYCKKIEPMMSYQLLHTTVSSLRLDALLATTFHLSRQTVKEYIENGLVSVNWKEETKGHTEITLADTVSLRRYGRIVLHDVQGISKSGKLKVQIYIVNNKK
ncbi:MULTISPECIES: RNA-binding protein [unclassified Granulicatella]|uniref:YlmH family RNA-binding protein n=1 Tax=unclassified Granulicatella TaxID=2630493 RepID=UPI0014311AB6|nr:MULTISPECIES: YlmH/Sll1252 family protein [unclassified Granulicatella]MBF0780414.1 RNA-binding protein [Granulicatella sp. 19428wC4_WM01]